MVDELDPSTLRYVLRNDQADEAVDLLDSGAKSDELATLIRQRSDLQSALDLVNRGIGTDRLVDLTQSVDWVTCRNLENWLGSIESVKGIDELVSNIDETANTGFVYEAKVASDLTESERIVRLGKSVSTSAGSTDIDVVTQSTLVEVKQGGTLADASSGSKIYNKLATKIAKYDAYAESNGFDQVKLVVRQTPSEDVRSLLQRKGVNLVIQ